MSITKAQTKALLAAHQVGGALNTSVNLKNGAAMRMIKRLVAAGLLADEAPYLITEKGRQALRDAGKLQDQKKFRILHQGEMWTLTTPALIRGEPATFERAKNMFVKMAEQRLALENA